MNRIIIPLLWLPRVGRQISRVLPRTCGWISILMAVLLGGLNAGCKEPPSASPVMPALMTTEHISPAATIGSITGPTMTATEVLPTCGMSTPTPSQTAPTPLISSKPSPTAYATSSVVPRTSPPTETVNPTQSSLALTPTASATSSPTPVTPTDRLTATRVVSPSMTPLPAATPTLASSTPVPPEHRFLPADAVWPDPSHPCPGCPLAPAYIVGQVTDAFGNPLAGVRLVCYNGWHRYPVVARKAAGEYDFPIIQAETSWYVVVLDQADQPISPEVAVHFDPHEACRYILHWRQTE